MGTKVCSKQVGTTESSTNKLGYQTHTVYTENKNISRAHRHSRMVRFLAFGVFLTPSFLFQKCCRYCEAGCTNRTFVFNEKNSGHNSCIVYDTVALHNRPAMSVSSCGRDKVVDKIRRMYWLSLAIGSYRSHVVRRAFQFSTTENCQFT